MLFFASWWTVISDLRGPSVCSKPLYGEVLRFFFFPVDRTDDLELFSCRSCLPPCLTPVFAFCLPVFLSALLLYVYLMCSSQGVESVCPEYSIHLVRVEIA